MAKKQSKTFLPSTGNDKADTIIAIAVVGTVAYLGYKLVKIIATPRRVQDLENVFEEPTGVIPPTDTDLSIFKQKELAKLMDDIYQEVIGINIFYEPVIINRILNYNCYELEWANNYYLSTYGESLFEAINGEWDFIYYNEAKEKLRKCGLNY
jgi:hypothetical protein